MQFYWFLPEIIVLVLLAIGFIYGIVRNFKKDSAMYLQIITLAVGAVMLGQVFITITLVTGGTLSNGFHTGLLGMLGSYLFLFSAGFGEIDSLIDHREKGKYQLYAMIIPACLVLLTLFLWVYYDDVKIAPKIVYTLIVLAIASTLYFSIKHLLVPDEMMKTLRPYNGTVILFSLSTVAYITLMDEYAANFFCRIIMGISCGALPYLAERGQRKWYQ